MRNIDKYKNVLSFSVIYQEDPEGGYVVNVPALPGCHTQGETIDEAEQNIKEAILLFLESLKAHKEEVPEEPRILQGKVEVLYFQKKKNCCTSSSN